MLSPSLLVLAAVVLALSTYTDLARHRIPNVFSLGGAVLAVALQSMTYGMDGFLNSLAGWAVGLMLFIPFYMARGMAAGDVKLMAAVGACVGPKIAVAAVAGTLLFGLWIALAVVIAKRGARQTFGRYGLMLKTVFTTAKFIYVKPAAADAALSRFPYALAILVGSAAGIWWHTGTLFGLQ